MCAGHYIVICGYCARTERYAIRDPAAESCHLSISAATFEIARRAFGTDEDLLLVAVPEEHRAPSVDFGRVAATITAF